MEKLKIWQLVQVPQWQERKVPTIWSILQIKEKEVLIRTILWTEVTMDLEHAQMLKLDLMSNALRLALESFSKNMPSWSNIQLIIKNPDWKVVFDQRLTKWWENRISDS